MDLSNNHSALDSNNNKTFSEIHKTKITHLKKSLTSLKGLLRYTEELGDLLQQKKKESKELSKKVRELEKELKNKETELESKNSLIETKDSLIEEQAKMTELRFNEIQKLKEEIKKLAEDSISSDAINMTARGIIDELNKRLDQSNSEICNLKKEKESLEMRVNELCQSNDQLKNELNKQHEEMLLLKKRITKSEDGKSDKNLNSSGESGLASYSGESKVSNKRKYDDSYDLRNSGSTGLHGSQTTKIARITELKKYNYEISYYDDSLNYSSLEGEKCVKIRTNDLEFLRLAMQVYEKILNSLISIALKEKIKKECSEERSNHFTTVAKAGWDDRYMKDYRIASIKSLNHFNYIINYDKLFDHSNDDAFGELRLITSDDNSEVCQDLLKKLKNGLCEDYKNCSPNHKIQLFKSRLKFFNKKVGDDVTEECKKLREVFKDIITHHDKVNRHEANFFVAT